MPYNPKTKKGTFQTEQNVPQTFTYEVDSWVRDGPSSKRRKVIGESDLPHVDFMVIKVTTAGDKIHYDTIWGPFDDWGFLEGLLAYDFGSEGSIEISSAA